VSEPVFARKKPVQEGTPSALIAKVELLLVRGVGDRRLKKGSAYALSLAEGKVATTRKIAPT
jgi:hypothetical protein